MIVSNNFVTAPDGIFFFDLRVFKHLHQCLLESVYIGKKKQDYMNHVQYLAIILSCFALSKYYIPDHLPGTFSKTLVM